MLITSMVVSAAAFADLQALDDSQMSAATGEGLGFALEDFVLDTEGAELSVTGIQSSAGEEIDIKWTSLYVMGEGSDEGSIRTPGQIGSYLHPYVIRSLRGREASILMILCITKSMARLIMTWLYLNLQLMSTNQMSRTAQLLPHSRIIRGVFGGSLGVTTWQRLALTESQCRRLQMKLMP